MGKRNNQCWHVLLLACLSPACQAAPIPDAQIETRTTAEQNSTTPPAPLPPHKESQQPPDLIDEILKDNKPHFISVAFQDIAQVRVRTQKGVINDQSGRTLTSNSPDVTSSLNSVFSKYKISAFSSEFIDITPEQESILRAQEAELEKNSSVDLPNRASIISIELDNYTPEKLKNLVLELQRLPFVRTAHVPPLVENAD